MDAYSLNSQVLPGKPLSQGDHRKTAAIGIFVLVIAILIGAAYWMSSSKEAVTETAVDRDAKLRAQIAALLQKAPVHASSEEVNHVASLLEKARGSEAPSDQSTIANLLKGK
jgi:hypothetical protein